jgi:hypothetical protein
MCERARVIYQLKANAGGALVARRIVARELSGSVSPNELDHLLLLTSELVSERVGSGAHHEVLTLDLTEDEVVRCGISDHGPASLPSGWRSVVLDRFADAWGLNRSHDCTHLWFESAIESFAHRERG